MEYAHGSRMYDGLKKALVLPAAIAGASMLAQEAFTVRADDSLSKKALRALPSALIAPEAGGNKVVDITLAAGMATVSHEMAKQTTSEKELALIGLGAQVLACAVNTAIGEAGWLNETEKQQEDVGFSSIAMAWSTKYLLDRAADAKGKKERFAWSAGAAALIGVATVGAYMTKDSIGGKLDTAAHTSGAAVGVAAHLIDRRQKK